MSEEQARRVGVLAGEADHDDIVVVEGAIRRSDAVVTSDEAHIRRITKEAHKPLRIEVV